MVAAELLGTAVHSLVTTGLPSTIMSRAAVKADRKFGFKKSKKKIASLLLPA